LAFVLAQVVVVVESEPGRRVFFDVDLSDEFVASLE
jgi:hypothetical protein